MKNSIVNAFRSLEKPHTNVAIDLPFGRHTTYVKLGNWSMELSSYKVRVKESYPVSLLPKEVRVETVTLKSGKKLIEISYVGNKSEERTNLLIKYIDQVGEYHEALQIKEKRKWNKVNTTEWIFPTACIEDKLLKMFNPQNKTVSVIVEEPVEEFNGDVTDHYNYGC
jgi:disulfide oxidoreductase YuzD